MTPEQERRKIAEEEALVAAALKLRSEVQSVIRKEVHNFAMNNSLSMEVSGLIILIAELRMLGDIIADKS